MQNSHDRQPSPIRLEPRQSMRAEHVFARMRADWQKAVNEFRVPEFAPRRAQSRLEPRGHAA